ncbi:phage holin family protein [Curvibacter sp. HBC28]|uniref:Phage holin family protein n=1 Tax=Curvibacter microcysteis TaxID=3026419 RepID=A0ABT5MF86_9BURK|nr:phage holin family protein [Curvibacter sp. HBC28]MDD0814577.1 phage holin family protein [Curvibacter sp. HBC28]
MKWLSFLGLDQRVQRVRQGAADLAQAAEDRVELLTIEWAEEKQRLQRIVLLAVLGAVLTSVVLIVLSAAVMVQFWDTPWRVTVAWSVAGVWLLLWLGLALALVQALRAGHRAFALTRRELLRDWHELKDGL